MKAPMRMKSFFAHLDAKRTLALVLGPGAAAIGGDAAIAHFAGREMAHPAQLLPASAHAGARYRGGRARRLQELRVKTTVTELADSRVRVQVEVPPGELEGSVERKAQQLARELKLPGFRRGKVPAPLVIQRIGREAVLEQAVRDALSSWYSDAIDSAGVVPVGDPQLDLGALPPTDRFMILHGLHYLELEGGRVRRARGFFDLYDAATQLGLLPQRGSFTETAMLLLRGFWLRPRA